MKWKKISRMITLILPLVMLIGCGTNTNAQKIEENTTLTIAFPDTITTLDIADGSAATMLKEVAGVVETLVAVDSEFQLHPMLATQWERTDDLTWIFQLREDVTFHDGTKFDAEAVKWCIDRSLAQNVSFANTTGIASVSVLDDYILEIKTSVKTGDLPEAFTNVNTAIIAKSSVNEKGEFINAVGTGFFKEDRFDISSGKFECIPYDGYWQDVDTNITRRVIVSMPDSSTRSLSVQNGEVNIATDVPFSDLQTLENIPGIDVQNFFTARTYFYSFNLNKEYFQDERVRKALIYALNKQEIVEDVLLGVGAVPKGIFIESMPWANTEVENYDYNIEKAKALLAEAGYLDTDGDGYLDKGGNKLSLRIITTSRRPGNALIVQATQGYFARIGIDSSVDVLETNAMNEVAARGDFDLQLNSAATGYIPSASYYLDTYYHSNSQNAKAIGYQNLELDRLIEECKGTSSMEEKIRLSKEAQVIAQNDAAVYTVAHYGTVFVLTDTIRDFSYSAAVHDFIVPNETKIE